MKCCCKAWCVGSSLALLGLLGAGGAAYYWNKPAPVVVETKPAPTDPHAKPPQVLASTLQRLHAEALAHFHADPKNGYLRMPPVFEKVAKEWKTPWFSSGELDDSKPIPFAKDMKNIHAASVKDFLSFRPLPAAAAAELGVVDGTGHQSAWDTRNTFAFPINKDNYDAKKKVWEVKSVDLVGLLKNANPVVYVSEKTAEQNATEPAPTRPLDEFEFAGLTALAKGQDLFGRSRDNVIRLLGSVRAETSCLACHQTKTEGDLLGAFSYVLREAQYARAGLGGRPKTMPTNGAKGLVP